MLVGNFTSVSVETSSSYRQMLPAAPACAMMKRLTEQNSLGSTVKTAAFQALTPEFFSNILVGRHIKRL